VRGSGTAIVRLPDPLDADHYTFPISIYKIVCYGGTTHTLRFLVVFNKFDIGRSLVLV
jgi:hypothetical protein